MRREKPETASRVSFLLVNVTVDKASSFALVINDHLRIEIPAGFDPVMQKQVVQALEAA